MPFTISREDWEETLADEARARERGAYDPDVDAPAWRRPGWQCNVPHEPTAEDIPEDI